MCTQLMFISLKHRRAAAHIFLEIIIDFLFTPRVLPYEDNGKHRRRHFLTERWSVSIRYIFLAKSFQIEYVRPASISTPAPARARACARLAPLVCHTSDQIHEIKLKLMCIELKAFHNHRRRQ